MNTKLIAVAGAMIAFTTSAAAKDGVVIEKLAKHLVYEGVCRQYDAPLSHEQRTNWLSPMQLGGNGRDKPPPPPSIGTIDSVYGLARDLGLDPNKPEVVKDVTELAKKYLSEITRTISVRLDRPQPDNLLPGPPPPPRETVMVSYADRIWCFEFARYNSTALNDKNAWLGREQRRREQEEAARAAFEQRVRELEEAEKARAERLRRARAEEEWVRGEETRKLAQNSTSRNDAAPTTTPPPSPEPEKAYRSPSDLTRAYELYAMVKHCHEVRSGYLMVYVSDSELERARQAARDIERYLKQWLDPKQDTDALWSIATESVEPRLSAWLKKEEATRTYGMVRNYLPNPCKKDFQILLDLHRTYFPEARRIEKDF